VWGPGTGRAGTVGGGSGTLRTGAGGGVEMEGGAMMWVEGGMVGVISGDASVGLVDGEVEYVECRELRMLWSCRTSCVWE
jgi:hypothetical protein